MRVAPLRFRLSPHCEFVLGGARRHCPRQHSHPPRLGDLAGASDCGYPSPTADAIVRTVMAGIRRAKGTAQHGKKPLVTEDLRRIVGRLPDSLQGIRDRALLLVGFAGAFRRSELVGLDIQDLEFGREGLVVTVRRRRPTRKGREDASASPTGRTRRPAPSGRRRPGSTCWTPARGLSCGASTATAASAPRGSPTKAVALIVKRCATAAGLAPADLAGHSLRAGLATAAAAAGVSERAIMAQTGQRSLATLRKYIREGSLFLENAAAKVGL